MENKCSFSIEWAKAGCFHLSREEALEYQKKQLGARYKITFFSYSPEMYTGFMTYTEA